MKFKERIQNKYLIRIFQNLEDENYFATRKLLRKRSHFFKSISSQLRDFDRDDKFDDAIYFYIGEFLLKTDEKSAYIVFENGAECGNSKCIDTIARAYANGEHGFRKNLDKGVELYKKVIANDDDNVLVGKAYRNLGIIRYRLQFLYIQIY